MNTLKIKHLIIVRFLNIEMNLGKKIYDRDVIENGKKLLKKYLIPSLENQTNKNFSLVLLINNNINEGFINFELNTSFETIIIHTNELNSLIKNFYADNDFVITTRQDYDDLIYNDFVNETQKSVDINIPFKIHGYVHGAKMKTNKPGILYKFSPYNDEDSEGLIGIGLSLISSTKYNYKYNIYYVAHHKIKNLLKLIYKDYNLEYNDSYFEKSNINLSYIYIRHMYNDSKKNEEIFNNQFKISNEEFKKLFGIDI